VNLIIFYLKDRYQVIKCNGTLFSSKQINTGIVQVSGIGPIFYVAMDSDLVTYIVVNILVKYADDTNLLLPADTDLDLAQEFNNMKHWAAENKR